MSAIIEVNNLWKKYQLGEKHSYLTLRDTIMQTPKSLLGNWSGATSKLGKNDFWALKNISFTVSPGEVVGIIGRNGAGKSTLLKIISRITYPTRGEIKLRGRVASLLEIGTGFSPELTGRENIYLNGSILGMARKEIDQKFDEIVNFADIEKFLDTPVKHYSSGMYMRLAFSVAANLETDILLVDEVLAVGDVEFQKKCLRKMEQVTQKEGRTILFVSHNLTAVRNLCTRCILLKNGSISDMGDTEEIINKYLRDSSKLMAQPIQGRTDRQGNGKIKVNKVTILQNNKPVNELIAGEDAVIRIHYHVFDRPKNPITVAVAINESSSQGRLLLLSSSVLDKNINIPINKKDNFIDFFVKKFPFTPGTYSFNTWVDCQGEMLDWVIEAGKFTVLFGDYYHSGKLPQQSQGSMLVDYDIL